MNINVHYGRKVDEQEKSYTNFKSSNMVITNNSFILLVVCEDGYYGENCKSSCGNCSHMEVCDKQNGTCYQGCINHFKEPKCDGKKTNILFFIANLTIYSWCLFHLLNFLQFVKTDFTTEVVLLCAASV